MALVTCRDCGKDVSERAKVCPHCGAPMQEDATVRRVEHGPEVQKVVVGNASFQGGYEAGYGCMTLLTSAAMSFIAFIVIWIFGSIYLAVRTGMYVEGEDPALWVGFVIFVLPFILAYVLRKPIRKVMAVILGSIFFLIILIPVLILTLWIVGEFINLIF